MIDKILKIADQNPYGFTVNKDLKHAPRKGYAVAMKETQNSFGVEGLKKVVEYAINHNTCIGGWKEKEKYYFDASVIYEDREEAIRKGREQEQIAIFDLEKGEPIYL